MNTQTPIIDTHFHIWNTQILTLPWLQLFKGRFKPIYTLEDYQSAIEGTPIKLSCYEEVDTLESLHSQEAQMAIALCDDPSNQVRGATIGVNLNAQNFQAYIERYAKKPAVKSVRHNFFAATPSISKSATFIENVHLLDELGLMCDLVMPADQIQYGVDLVKSCPNTVFIVNHCGVYPILADASTHRTWQNGIEAYGQHKNAICKISEFGFTNPDYPWEIADVLEIIKHCITSFGEDNVVYGSNWPVCELTSSIQQWLTAIRKSLDAFPLSYQKKLFYDNAQRLYGL